VKPENLLLTTDGSTLVADFGIARAVGETSQLTGTGMVVGTPAYMSPEQAAGESALDPRTDVYSLGCVLYEMLTGETPFTGINPQALLAKRLSEPVPHLRTTREVPVAVEKTVTRALARAPADRYASAGELARALAAIEDPSRGGGSARPRAVGRWVAGGLLVVVAAAVVLALRQRWPGTGEGATASAAVLPFADLSEGKDQEYFSDGLTDELISALSRVEGIRVAARTSSFQFKGRSIDVREVGRKLAVGSVLEGSVRRSGNRVRITAQLVNARDGYQLWTDEYDRELADVFAVQEEIARAIIGALRVKLGVKTSDGLRARPTHDLQAYDAYLRGRFAWNQRTRTGLQEAVRYLEQAVGRDSSFALAWAALAEAYLLIYPYAGIGARDSTWPKARAAAEKALALNPALGEAHTALAYGAMIYQYDWPTAEASFRQAITVDSTYPTGHQWYGNFLWSRGRLDEALQQMQEAHRLDPLSLMIGTELGQTLYLQRHFDQAETHLREVLALDPNYPHALYILGLVYAQQGRYREAIEVMRRSVDLGGQQEDLAGGLGYAYGASGDRAATARYLVELERGVARGEIGPFALALAYAGQGELTRAFEQLNRAIDVHDIFLPEKFFDPQLDRLRADPRFAKVEERMGIHR
jgi:serine/threonine-protein kinase